VHREGCTQYVNASRIGLADGTSDSKADRDGVAAKAISYTALDYNGRRMMFWIVVLPGDLAHGTKLKAFGVSETIASFVSGDQTAKHHR
jgi:hypothetical protein